MWPLQDGAGKPVMMTQQPGREKWDSWEMNEFAALFSVTNEAGKWVRTTGWLAAQLGRDTRRPGQRGGTWRGELHHGANETGSPQKLSVDGNAEKVRRDAAGGPG